MNYSRLVLLFCLSIWYQIQPVSACRYNIRETGFVDIGSDPYHFYCFVNHNTPEETTSAFRLILHTAFIDCNIIAEVIDVDSEEGHEAMKYLSLMQIQSFPACILVSPDGRSLAMQIKKDNEPFELSLKSVINSIIFSPVREGIINEVIKTYGVVLLIEGKNQQVNDEYRKAVLSALATIKHQMKMMVKNIKYPPVLITLKPESFPDEKVLLWSLGLGESVEEPHAAVFYGKARWIGPLIKSEEISETNLVKILSIIGLDCECGLDVSWVQGTVLPLRWDQKRQAQVAGSLEFDPENPLVKLEVTRILKTASASFPGVPVMFNDSATVRTDQDSDGYIIDKKKSWLRIHLYFTLSLAVVIILTGLILLIRARK